MAPKQKSATFAVTSTNGSSPPGGGTAGQNQGTPKLLGKFVSTAYGPPWVGIQGTGVTADGTDLRPAKQIYGVAVDPSVVKLGTYLLIQPNPFNWNGAFKAFDTGGAIKGNRIDFYDWRGRAKQNAWGRKSVTVYSTSDPTQTMTPPPSGGGISLPSIPNPLSAADDAAHAIADFIRFVLSPKDIAALIARIAAYVLKLYFKAVWDFVVAPILHWHQRAAQWYYTNIMLEQGGQVTVPGPVPGKSTTLPPGGAAFVTLSFWATGFAILWARADGKDGTGLFASKPHRTALGQLIRSAGNSVARRRLIKPGDVKKKTKTKPTPQTSSTQMDEVRRLSVDRPRTVRVGGLTPDEGEAAA